MAHDLYQPDGWEGCAACRVCGGFEGSLPTECPGRRMTRMEEQRVYAGVLDFNNGSWHNIECRGLVIRFHEFLPGTVTPLDAVDRWAGPDGVYVDPSISRANAEVADAV